MKKIFFVFVAVVMLSACGSKEKDAAYYTNHPEEMKQKLEECSKMSTAEKMADRECTGAINAASDKFFKSTMDRNPLEGPGKGRGTKHF